MEMIDKSSKVDNSKTLLLWREKIQVSGCPALFLRSSFQVKFTNPPLLPKLLCKLRRTSSLLCPGVSK